MDPVPATLITAKNARFLNAIEMDVRKSLIWEVREPISSMKERNTDLKNDDLCIWLSFSKAFGFEIDERRLKTVSVVSIPLVRFYFT